MSRFTARFAALTFGMTVPILAWSLADPGNADVPEQESVEIFAASLLQNDTSGAQASLDYDTAVSGQADGDRVCSETSDESEVSGESTTACCWVFFHGRWWCFSC